MDGQAVRIHSPAAARALGIETVYQDLALFDNLGPAANFYAGRTRGPALAAAMASRPRSQGDGAATDELLERLGWRSRMRMSGRADVRRAASGRRRRSGGGVRLKGRDPRRADRRPRRARVAPRPGPHRPPAGREHGVIVISHALDHVIEVADRAVVMRRGRVVGEELPRRRTERGSCP